MNNSFCKYLKLLGLSAAIFWLGLAAENVCAQGTNGNGNKPGASQPKVAPPSDSEQLTVGPFRTGEDLVNFYSDVTGRIAIRGGAPSQMLANVRLNINQVKLSKEEAMAFVQSIFAANNLAIVHQGDRFFKIVILQQARQEGVPFNLTDGRMIASDNITSRLFQLKYMDPKEVEAIIKPNLLGAGTGFSVAFPRTNSLLVIDRAANILEIAKIIEHLDRPLEARIRTKFYQLQNAKAKDVVAQIEDLLKKASPQKPGVTAPSGVQPQPGVEPMPGEEGAGIAPQVGGGGELVLNEENLIVGKATLTADERTNQIILLTREVNFPFFDQMIERLDASTAAPTILKKIELKYADSEELSGLLNQVLGKGGGGGTSSRNQRLTSSNTGSSTSTGTQRSTARQQQPPAITPPSTPGSAGAAGASKVPGISETLGVFADHRTNSLIVLGTAKDIEWVENFIKDVDVLLAQILIEGIVAEVTLNRTDSFGVEVFAKAISGRTHHGFLANNADRFPLDTAALTLATLPATGLTGGLNYFASIKDLQIDALIQAVADNSNVRVLSQPIIQTSHNEEAEIKVGEQRPVITSTQNDLSGAGNAQIQTVEFKDIDLSLHVKPIVNPNGLVTLDIIQQIQTVSGTVTVNGNAQPIISTREAKSKVSVQDRSTIILGGLIKHEDDHTRSGIPGLMDIPVLGYLFGTTTKTKVRTELLVLIKPTVLWTPEAATAEQKARREALTLFRKRKFNEAMFNEEVDRVSRPASFRAEEVDEDELEKNPAPPLGPDQKVVVPQARLQPELRGPREGVVDTSTTKQVVQNIQTTTDVPVNGNGARPPLKVLAHIATVNEKENFVVVDFHSNEMPPAGTEFPVLRNGKKVGVIKLTPPVRAPLSTADIVSGDIQPGDVVQ